MGYEIAGGMGVRRAAPDRDVLVLVGDGSYLMLHTELVTAVAEGLKIVVVLIQNHGYASIGHLSETVGSERYGTQYRFRDPDSLDFQGEERLPVDLAANARSYGVDVIEVEPGPDAIEDLKSAVRAAKASDRTTVVHVNSDPLLYAPDGGGWWDVPVAGVSTLDSTRRARAEQDRTMRGTTP
jgi:3D-(3,5/4)-trihydroxycyclohexane-1,2-dione acylhydrolase (decyclizing)